MEDWRPGPDGRQGRPLDPGGSRKTALKLLAESEPPQPVHGTR